jgi:hypothetical protein
VRFNDIERAVGRNHWPWHALNARAGDQLTCINLSDVRHRIPASGLD